MNPSAACSIGGRLRAVAGSFAEARDGAAVVEFALIMPLLLMLYFGSIEASSLFTVDRRVTIIAGTVGDLVAQWNPEVGEIPQATIDDYFAAAEAIMNPYDPTGIQQVVSFVKVDPGTGATEVLWSEATGGGTARAAGTSYPLAQDSQMNKIARTGQYFVAAETAFSYKPVLGLAFPSPLALSHVSYFLPRFGECIDAAGSAACP